MERYVYLSDAEKDLLKSHLNDYAYHAEALSITGFVFHSRCRFLFYFEGKPEDVESFLGILKICDEKNYIFHLKLATENQNLFTRWITQEMRDENIRSFHHEHYIEQCMLYIKHDFGNSKRYSDFILRNIQYISRHQAKTYSILPGV